MMQPSHVEKPIRQSGLLARLFTLNSVANFVYFLYASLVLIIDFYFSEAASNAFRYGNITTIANITHPTADPIIIRDGTDDYYYESTNDPYVQAMAKTNIVFVAAASLHLFNALQYFGVWPNFIDPRTGTYYTLFSYVQIPEYLNIIEATLYLYTAVKYSSQTITGPNRYMDNTTYNSHKIELAAASVELLAAFSWFYVWWCTHERGPGRGVTFDDSEFIALILLVIPSFLYVAYNIMVVYEPKWYYDYSTPELERMTTTLNIVYTSGDVIYAAGAAFYVITSFRDAGFFSSFGVFGPCFRGKSGGDGGVGVIATPSPLTNVFPVDPPPAAIPPHTSAITTSIRLVEQQQQQQQQQAALDADSRAAAMALWSSHELPPGWTWGTDDDGDMYYVQPDTLDSAGGVLVEGKSQWEDPRETFELFFAEYKKCATKGRA